MSAGTVEAPVNGAANGNGQAGGAMVTRNQPQPTQPPQRLIVQDNGPLSFLLDTAKYEHLQRIAKAMSQMSFLPDHLCTVGPANNKTQLPPERIAANCILIVNQAMRWGIDPYALAPETYVVSGKLGYQGKLVAAIVNTRAGLKGRLSVSYEGQGLDRTATVSGTFEGETEARTIQLSVKQAKTDNKMWTADPDQKLWYSAVTKWARRHCPEVLLGVLTDDDIERMAQPQVIPSETTLVGSKSDMLAEQLQSRLIESRPATVTETAETTETVSPSTTTATEPQTEALITRKALESRIAAATRHTELHDINALAKEHLKPEEFEIIGRLCHEHGETLDAMRAAAAK